MKGIFTLLLCSSALLINAQTCTLVELGDSTTQISWATGDISNNGMVTGTMIPQDGLGDMIIFRNDINGNRSWSRRIGTTDPTVALVPEFASSTSTGGIVVGGLRVIQNYTNYFAFELSATGEIVWARIYQAFPPGWSVDMQELTSTPGGGAIMIAVDHASSSNIVTKLDAGGAPIWSKRYILNGPNDGIQLTSVDPMPNGDLLFTGYANTNIPPRPVVIHTNTSGVVNWYRILEANFAVHSACPLANGDLVMGGIETEPPFRSSVMAIGPTGQHQWSKHYSLSYPFERIEELSNGELMVCGPATLTRTTSDGTPLDHWTHFNMGVSELVGVHGDSALWATTTIPDTLGDPFFPILAMSDNGTNFSCSPMSAATLPIYTQGITPTLSTDTLSTVVDSIKTWTMSLLHPSASGLDIISQLASGFARPGFDLRYFGLISNQGTSRSGPITATLTFDPQLTYVSATPPPTAVVGNTVTWNSLDPLGQWDEHDFVLNLLVPIDTSLLGDLINASLFAHQDSAEIELMNNTGKVELIVTGSYDPNDKLVSPENVFDPANDSLLNYTIRFQNTGTDTAFTVVVVDTLPEHVSVGSFLQGPASHPYTYELNAQGILTFTFNNILLPDSNVNEAGSHGLVNFSVKPDEGLAIGTLISNTGDIYFDFNPSIRTPPANVIYGLVTGVPIELSNDEVLLFPVPVQTTFTAILPEGFRAETLTITALDGRLIQSSSVQQVTNKLLIPVGELAGGVYVLTLTNNNGKRLGARFVKE